MKKRVSMLLVLSLIMGIIGIGAYPDGDKLSRADKSQTAGSEATAETTATPDVVTTATPEPVATENPEKARQKVIDKGKWKIKKKNVYYYDGNGKKVKGFVKIKKKYYYFDKNGIQRTGWRKIKGKYYFFKLKNKSDGYMVKNKKVNRVKLDKNGAAKTKKKWIRQKLALMVKCQNIVNKITNSQMTTMQKMKKSYDWERKNFYIKGSHKFHASAHWDLVYAKRMMKDSHGACFEWGALYAYLANAAGAKKCYSVSSGGHGWSEVEGKVCDPDWEFANPSNSYFMLDYDLSGTGGRPNYKRYRGYLRRI